jgi:hypothetical protein
MNRKPACFILGAPRNKASKSHRYLHVRKMNGGWTAAETEVQRQHPGSSGGKFKSRRRSEGLLQSIFSRLIDA